MGSSEGLFCGSFHFWPLSGLASDAVGFGMKNRSRTHFERSGSVKFPWVATGEVWFWGWNEMGLFFPILGLGRLGERHCWIWN
jgi:hypothetical protein